VYVEKPFSIDAEEAQAMVQLAEQSGLKITAGHNVQFSPEMIRMRERVREGFLGGRPVHIESTFSYSLGDGTYVKSLLGDESHWVRALPGKLLQNLISHGVAKIAEFVDSGEITVSAFGFTSPKLQSMGETEIVDEVRVLISDSQRTTAYFTFTTQMAPPVQELRVFGPKASIIVDNLHRTVIERTRANSDCKSYVNFLVPPAKMARQYAGNLWANTVAFIKADFHMDQGMRNLIDAFYQSIRAGTAPPIPYREILVTAAVMDQIFSQLDRAMRQTAATAIEAQPAAAVWGGRR
jgi:predicted dehydrogenase